MQRFVSLQIKLDLHYKGLLVDLGSEVFSSVTAGSTTEFRELAQLQTVLAI